MDATCGASTADAPALSILEFTFSDRDANSELMLMCNHRRFIISLAAESFSQSDDLRSKYLFFLRVAEEYEVDGYTVEDFYDWIVEPLLPTFRELPEAASHRTLQDFIFPETYKYTLFANGDTLATARLDVEGDAEPIFGIQLPDDVCEYWPLFEPHEVRLCAERERRGPPSSTPSKVLFRHDSIAYLKLYRPGDKRALLKEIGTYRRIHAAGLDETLHISRLLGLVRDNRGQVFGLLLSYIDCGRKTLFCASKPGTSTQLKEKWALQVTDIVAQLHKAGIVWGDAKADNVLIDRNEDAWLIDFGGGYTEGWVPEELEGSIEGDSAGLEKIIEFTGT